MLRADHKLAGLAGSQVMAPAFAQVSSAQPCGTIPSDRLQTGQPIDGQVKPASLTCNLARLLDSLPPRDPIDEWIQWRLIHLQFDCDDDDQQQIAFNSAVLLSTGKYGELHGLAARLLATHLVLELVKLQLYVSIELKNSTTTVKLCLNQLPPVDRTSSDWNT